METFSALLALSEGNPPVTKASDAELRCVLSSTIEQIVEQTIETPVIWDAIALIMTSLYAWEIIKIQEHIRNLVYVLYLTLMIMWPFLHLFHECELGSYL